MLIYIDTLFFFWSRKSGEGHFRANHMERHRCVFTFYCYTSSISKWSAS